MFLRICIIVSASVLDQRDGANYVVLTDTPEIASDTICFLAAKKRYWLAGRYIDCTWDMEELLNREKEIVDGDKFKMKMKF
jgi:hypothetical protein